MAITQLSLFCHFGESDSRSESQVGYLEPKSVLVMRSCEGR